MATLATITAGAGLPVTVNGPFAVAGNLYQLCHTSGAALEIFMSADGGNTWTLQDSTHAPTALLSPSFCYDGVSTLWIAYANSSGDITVISFDCLTNLYGALTATTNASSGNYTYVFFRTSDSQLVITNAITSAGVTQPLVFLFDTLTSTYTAYQDCGPIGSLGVTQGAFAGASNLTILVFADDKTGLMQIQSISGGGSLGALTTIDTGALGAAEPGGFCGIFVNGVNVLIAWANDGPGAPSIAALEAPIATLAFSKQLLSTPGDVDGVAAVIQSGVYKVIAFTPSGIYLYQDSGGGFGAPGTIILTPGGNNITANLVPGSPGIGIVIDQSPPVSFVVYSALIPSASAFLTGGSGVILPSSTIGTLCSFARQVRPKGRSLTPMVIGNNITFGKPYAGANCGRK
jgi:hypothetical protein